jgi:stage V sporulation protein G
MKITDVRVTKLEGMKNLKAMASITFDDCFVVGGLKVMTGKNGEFISMPSQKNKNDEYKDVCFPVTKEFRQEMIDAIMTKYNGSKKETTGTDDEMPDWLRD